MQVVYYLKNKKVVGAMLLNASAYTGEVLKTRHTLEPLPWHWSHWPSRERVCVCVCEREREAMLLNASAYTGEVLKRHFPPRLTNLPGQWLQCQATGSNVCRVLGVGDQGSGLRMWSSGIRVQRSEVRLSLKCRTREYSPV